MTGRQWAVAVLAGIVVLVIVIAGNAHDGKKSDTTTTASPDVTVDVSKSSCVATGVSDVYTGDGRVVFLFTLRNAGDTRTVNVTPIRHYDDGETNESAMDMLVDVQVPGFTAKRYSSPQYKYEAHAHDVSSCGLRIDSGDEITIPARHL